MRILVLGDFHIDRQQPELTERAMEDAARTSPDLVIPLGDFGRNGLIGTPEGIEEAKGYLDTIGVPLRPIMGNHDLERESAGKQPKGTMEAAFLRLFGQSEPYGVLEFKEWRLFFASTEPQPEDSCYDVQECYVTDAQFNALVVKLKERPGVPVIFFTHAPPIGCGLRTVPRVHVRSTNAYLDQNHDPYRWLELVRAFPEIVMWFSAHYHLSHAYTNSHTEVHGTHFFLTGVHSSCTRDGKRQSRILELDSGGVSVRTLDHSSRQITPEGSFEWQGRPGGMAEIPAKPSGVSQGAPQDLSAAAAPAVRLIRECPVGEAPSVPYGVVSLPHNRYLVGTGDGFSWEAEPDTSAVLGTLHLGPPLRSITATAGICWLAWDRSLGYSDLSSPWRFVRLEKGIWPEAFHTFAQPVEALAPKGDGTVWAAAGGWLWEASPAENGLKLEPAIPLPESCRQLTAADGQAWVVGQSGTLYHWTASAGKLVAVRGQVAAWDVREGETAAVIAAADHYEVEISGKKVSRYLLPGIPDPAGPAQILALGQGAFVVVLNGKAYAGGGGMRSPLPLNEDSAGIHAVSRCSEDAWQFAVSTAGEEEGTGLLQIWQIQPPRS
ncbi:metallophosphoesterase [Paenibacillus sp. S150]|uniref:metallophosphoesterase family protein n=1 Tax=Paenibacillus sp. S150 TaxID=2749826 RepID=UPI001C56BE9A|nr:metallophosphoesterase [Paenibacillus sp. S150]MBW4084313.1 metallophosphoesterase [Paenibacillus sp. S150]